MGVSKVEFGDQTLLDLTGDTVNENNLLSGATAHGADGEPINGNVIVHDVIDNLLSDSSEDALSAKQGKALNTAINALKDRMILGTLGTGGTASVLPSPSSENNEWVYKVISDGDYSVSNVSYYTFQIKAGGIASYGTYLTINHFKDSEKTQLLESAVIDEYGGQLGKKFLNMFTVSTGSDSSYGAYWGIIPDEALYESSSSKTIDANTKFKIYMNDKSLHTYNNIGETTHAIVGDMFISTGVKWEHIPSGYTYTLPTASKTTLGGVKADGSTTTIDPDGTIHAKGGSGGSTTLSGLTDVDLSNLVEGQVLKYDSASQKWVNGQGGGNVPEGTMIYKGTVGTGGTIEVLPSASATNKGHVYKVIEDKEYNVKNTQYYSIKYTGGTTTMVYRFEEFTDNTFKTVIRSDEFDPDRSANYPHSFFGIATISDKANKKITFSKDVFNITTGTKFEKNIAYPYAGDNWKFYSLDNVQTAQIGDLFISNGTEWVYIPSGYTYTLPTASTTTLGGVKVDGTTITVDANGVITAVGEEVPQGMMFYKGTVGTGGTVGVLPTPSAENNGYVYKVLNDSSIDVTVACYLFEYLKEGASHRTLVKKYSDSNFTNLISETKLSFAAESSVYQAVDNIMEVCDQPAYGFFRCRTINNATVYDMATQTLITADGVRKSVNHTTGEAMLKASYSKALSFKKDDLIVSNGTEWVLLAGTSGASIDDTTTASDKVWSSTKVDTEIGKVSDSVNNLKQDLTHVKEGSRNLAHTFLFGDSATPYKTALNFDAELKPSTQYTLSFRAPSGLRLYTNENLFDSVHIVADGDVMIMRFTTVASISKSNAPQATDGLWRILKTDTNNAVIPSFSEIMLQEGNITRADLRYEPYYEGTVELTSKAEQLRDGGKNLLNCNGLTTQTLNGVTFTPVYGANGELEYINVNGTNGNARTDYNLLYDKPLSANGSVTVSGCPSGGSGSTYALQLWNATTNTGGNDFGSGYTYNYNGTDLMRVIIIVRPNQVCNNLKFYPQIELGNTKTDYEPFYKGTVELTNDVSELKSNLNTLLELEEIPKNQDLNNYVETGVYTSAGSTVTGTLSNCPVTMGFRLEVKKITNNVETRMLQILYPNVSGSLNFYMRTKTGAGTDSWNTWYKFGGTAV